MARYEERLFIRNLKADSLKDENGDYISNEASDWHFISECREEPSDKGRNIANVDGDSIEYTSIIQLPGDCPQINVGVEIQVRDMEDNVIFEATAIRYKQYRKNARLWV